MNNKLIFIYFFIFTLKFSTASQEQKCYKFPWNELLTNNDFIYDEDPKEFYFNELTSFTDSLDPFVKQKNSYLLEEQQLNRQKIKPNQNEKNQNKKRQT